MKFQLLLKDIELSLRENFLKFQEKLEAEPILSGQWKFVEYSFVTNETALKIPHGLKFVPIDIIQTHLSGTGTLTWNYASFDSTNLVVTTASTSAASPLKVRAFIGRYAQGA